jgi:hypothetical protein
LEKPRDEDVIFDVVTQVYSCKNPDCKANVTVYWHESKLF